MAKTILMIKSDYLKFLKKREKVGKPIIDKIGKLNKFYLPLSEWIYSIYKKDNKTKIIGLSGGQGTGKSTITEILKFILKKKYGLNSCCFSIDDFYKTKAQRRKMSKNTHPLFFTRGVPGTHDIVLLNQIIKKLKKRNFKAMLVPKFDKSIDDRLKKNKWQKIKNSPDIIINCAAKVGGILANSTYPVEFFYENVQMQNNLLFAAEKNKVKRFIFLGSSCIYPKDTKTPITEDKLLTGRLEKTNEAYALAKISGIKLSEYLFNQNNLDVLCLMPTNIYGLKDNYDKFSSHVIPGMISKFIEAKKKNKRKIELLGTGRPMREFLFNEDLAEAIFCVLNSSKKKINKVCKGKFPIMNIGTGENISIKNLSEIIKRYVNFKGKIFFNSKYPDGTMKKNLNSSKMKKLGWKPKVKLNHGLKEIIKFRLI